MIKNEGSGLRILLFDSQYYCLSSCVILGNPLTFSDLVTLIYKVGIALVPLMIVKYEIISFC